MTMNNTLSKIIIFATGAAIGSAVTWKIVKTKYERIAQEEIDSVKEEFARLRGEEKTEEEESDDEDEEPHVPTEREVYSDAVEQLGYSTVSNYKEYNKEEVEDMLEPYVIPPEEFDENGYETETLYYYACGTLANRRDEIINNIDELIGEESLTHFGEYEMDSVFVRNDNLETDFEILKDNRRFSEVS